MAVIDSFRTTEIGGDSAVIQQLLSALPSGVTLDLTDVTDGFVPAGTVIIKDKTSGEYKPLTITAGKYIAVPTTAEVVGVLINEVSKTTPHASILTAGQVNSMQAPAMATSEIVTKLPRIEFLFNKEDVTE